MKKALAYFFVAISFSCGNKQVIAEIGKTVPDYTFKNILNSNRESISLKELRGKTIILEFWATWCSPCIPAMKKLNSLQSDFKNHLEIITISPENEKRLNKFIKDTNTNLRVVQDTLHHRLFEYRTIPHSIIIDKKGVVRAITNPQNITKEVLNKLIFDDIIDLEIKDDFYKASKLSSKTIASEINTDYSIVLKSFDKEKGFGWMPKRTLEGSVNGIEFYNNTIPQMYQTLFDLVSINRIVFKDGLSFDDFPYEKEYQYNLNIEVSGKHEKNWKNIGINFLNNNLNINARLGIDSLECYALKNIDNTIKKSNFKKTESTFKGPTFIAKKVKLFKLIKYLENYTFMPVIDLTNLKEEYDFELNWKFENPKTLFLELNKYGLKLEKLNKKAVVEVMQVYKKKQ